MCHNRFYRLILAVGLRRIQRRMRVMRRSGTDGLIDSVDLYLRLFRRGGRFRTLAISGGSQGRLRVGSLDSVHLVSSVDVLKSRVQGIEAVPTGCSGERISDLLHEATGTRSDGGKGKGWRFVSWQAATFTTSRSSDLALEG